jgi:hypothetical protein
MPCGEVPWVGSFANIESRKIHRATVASRLTVCTCPFWTPLPGSESDGDYTAHASPTFADSGNTNCIRELLYQDSRTDLSSGSTNAVSSAAGAPRSTSSSASLNHLIFVGDATGARFATYYPGIALIESLWLVYRYGVLQKMLLLVSTFATIWKEYEIGARLTSTLVL